ncbi:hypothetical protein BpHYR1_041309 [Brachionus plicatilis]|uniref:Uncharacterized protein n=1 Tax=Brachionus plicatilis TaxID=10195 RepID=A0A3M7R569_BRAPC|nr:hypothetical protein BpHYR1_041309 [Brachionus plicatilis]
MVSNQDISNILLQCELKLGTVSSYTLELFSFCQVASCVDFKLKDVSDLDRSLENELIPWSKKNTKDYRTVVNIRPWGYCQAVQLFFYYISKEKIIYYSGDLITDFEIILVKYDQASY